MRIRGKFAFFNSSFFFFHIDFFCNRDCKKLWNFLIPYSLQKFPWQNHKLFTTLLWNQADLFSRGIYVYSLRGCFHEIRYKLHVGTSLKYLISVDDQHAISVYMIQAIRNSYIPVSRADKLSIWVHTYLKLWIFHAKYTHENIWKQATVHNYYLAWVR